MDSVMPNLPLEITEQILLRIPARSVVRLKTVCKQWRLLISDPRFVRDHVNRSLLDEGNVRHRVVAITWNSSKYSIISSMSIDYASINLSGLNFRIESPVYPRILGSCNGLLLLANDDFDKPFICNPLFKEKCKYLPPCKSTSSSYHTGFVGFGYASSIDDYKVVALSSKMVSSDVFSGELDFVEIYSLKTDSWRSIPPYIPCTETEVIIPVFLKEGTHVQGSIYWVVSPYKFILGFDLTTEKYKLIDTPGDYPGPFDLVEIRGCLAAFRSGDGICKSVIWTWKNQQWSILLIVPTKEEESVQCLASINNHKLLLYVYEEDYSKELCSKFVICDLACMTFRDIPSARLDWVVHMGETLVSPIGGDDGSQV